jgi:purine-binding chemotaxis protein CheW
MNAGDNQGVNASVQYLTFKLEDEVYAVDVAKVREILDFPPITKVPRTPDFMRGVINLRGSVVPVVDMRLKFGMAKTERSVNTCIVVVEVLLENESTVIGALADSVQEVIELEPSQIEPPPKIGSRLKVEFLKGMGKIGERFLMILDIDKVFSAEEILSVQEAAGTKASAEMMQSKNS